MTLNRISAFAAAATISLTAAFAEDATSDKPINGWLFSESVPQEYVSGTTQVDGVTGKSAFIKAISASPTGNATLRQEIAADNYRGQRLRLSAEIKTDDAGRVLLWVRVDGPQMKMLHFTDTEDRPVSGTTQWKRYDVVLDVPSDAVDIAFGYNLKGDGTAWARAFKLEPVGTDVPAPDSTGSALSDKPVNADFSQ